MAAFPSSLGNRSCCGCNSPVIALQLSQVITRISTTKLIRAEHKAYCLSFLRFTILALTVAPSGFEIMLTLY
jgi:hypothetical protein